MTVRLLVFVQRWAPEIWTAEAIFGLAVCARLLWFARDQRRSIDGTRAGEVLRFLGRLAATATVTLVAILVIGVGAMVTRHSARPEAWLQLLTLAVLLSIPLALTWIVYRAFWLRFR